MTIYYDKVKKCFYDSGINVDKKVSDTVVEITEEQHQNLLNALNTGCIIFDDLTYSEAKPSDGVYNWNSTNKVWVKDEEATRFLTVPSVISRFQAMSILEETEITYKGNNVMIATAVQSYVDSLDSSTEANRAIKRAWNYASEFERTSSTISAIALLLELTDKQVDDMFIAAAKVKG